MSVNGCPRSLPELRKGLRQHRVLLKVERHPEAFAVTLHRYGPDDPCGLRTEIDRSERAELSLYVTEVLGGLSAKWNQEAMAQRHFHLLVHEGAEITQVNAQAGDPERMQRELFMPRPGRLLLVLRRGEYG